eukprot:jgi/Botrbrau1/18224/Bobra.53_1s0081.1
MVASLQAIGHMLAGHDHVITRVFTWLQACTRDCSALSRAHRKPWHGFTLLSSPHIELGQVLPEPVTGNSVRCEPNWDWGPVTPTI